MTFCFIVRTYIFKFFESIEDFSPFRYGNDNGRAITVFVNNIVFMQITHG